MNLSSVIPGANSPRFVNSQLVCLLPVVMLYWERVFFKYDTEKPLQGRCHYVFMFMLCYVKQAFLCFSLNRGNFFRLKAFHPFLVMYPHTIMLETSMSDFIFCDRKNRNIGEKIREYEHKFGKGTRYTNSGKNGVDKMARKQKQRYLVIY